MVRMDEDGAVMLTSTDHDHHISDDDTDDGEMMVTLTSLALGNPNVETVFK